MIVKIAICVRVEGNIEGNWRAVTKSKKLLRSKYISSHVAFLPDHTLKHGTVPVESSAIEVDVFELSWGWCELKQNFYLLVTYVRKHKHIIVFVFLTPLETFFSGLS